MFSSFHPSPPPPLPHLLAAPYINEYNQYIHNFMLRVMVCDYTLVKSELYDSSLRSPLAEERFEGYLGAEFNIDIACIRFLIILLHTFAKIWYVGSGPGGLDRSESVQLPQPLQPFVWIAVGPPPVSHPLLSTVVEWTYLLTSFSIPPDS